MRSFLQNYLFVSLLAIFLLVPGNLFSQNKNKINRINYNPVNIGDVTVKKWKDDKTAAFSFTFDDCMLSQYVHVFPMFQQFGFKGTFYVIVGSLKDSDPDWLYGTWPEFIQMSDAGQEIGSHTMTHPHLQDLAIGDTNTEGTLRYELYQSKKIIQQKIPDKQCIDFAYPYSEYDSDVLFYTSMYYEVARAISQNPVNSSLTGMEWFKVGSRVINFSLPRNSPDDDLDELQEFYNYIQNTIDHGKWGLLQAHDVVPFDSISVVDSLGSYEPISVQWFDSACQFVSDAEQNGDLWVAPVGDITRYMKERDSYYYNIVSVADSEIVINLSDTLINSIYNFPLTADIIVPDDWTDVSVFQGSFYDYTSAYFSGNSNVVQTSVVPDAGPIKLYRGLVTAVNENATNSPDEFKLYQNYPNPFNPTTTIRFTLANAGFTTIKIFNSLGEEVSSLINGYLNKGNHNLTFNASNLPSGIYFSNIRSGSFSKTMKMVLLR
jgi:peptidoglycan/xylan/chitin deacetylase (PgdA/CDA1 family)